jgi:hypothetical protein
MINFLFFVPKRLLVIAPVFVLPFFGIAQISTTNCTTAVLELSNSSGTTSANTTSPQTVTFFNNTNNPTGTTFAAYTTPTLTATYSISNIQYANMFYFDNPVFDNIDGVNGGGNVSDWTSANSATGTGMSPSDNYGIRFNLQTDVLNGNSNTQGPFYYGNLSITFNRPVDNPILHFSDIGGSRIIAALQKFFNSRYIMTSPSGATITRLSGSSTAEFDVSGGNTIFKSQNNGFGYGSVQINGLGITTISFEVYLESVATNAWLSGGVETVIISASYLDFGGPHTVSGNVKEDTDNNGTGDVNLVGVGITLYRDLNADGLLDAAELAAGPAVIDSDLNGVYDNSATTTTNASGNYNFNGVPSGNYIAVETNPGGYVSVVDNDVTPDAGGDLPNTNSNDDRIPISFCGSENDADNNFVDKLSTLPLRLLSFSGNNGGAGKNHIMWTIADAYNIEQIELERSDAVPTAFQKIYSVSSGINTTLEKQYFYYDLPSDIISYYRLKIFETNGSVYYSNILRLNNSSNVGSLFVFPNPSYNVITISGLKGAGELQIISPEGRLVRRIMINNQVITENVGNLKKGIYIIKFISNAGTKQILFNKI